MPFGNKSFEKENLRFLSVEQVMQDYVQLLHEVEIKNVNVKGRAVIAFGGSYGGMLAGWLRMKYPHKF
jgi:lysosomal Pro-X carboxypeptidase